LSTVFLSPSFLSFLSFGVAKKKWSLGCPRVNLHWFESLCHLKIEMKTTMMEQVLCTHLHVFHQFQWGIWTQSHCCHLIIWSFSLSLITFKMCFNDAISESDWVHCFFWNPIPAQSHLFT
jgi:hypothetical protein